MSRRVKEEERIESIIRSLLKLPENRRCINCNSLGPQYVCTTFWTFVCTNCSGVHREFTHRVKSVSMAKFKAEEVSSLQAAGNERAREIYFKEWDPQRHSFPDASNQNRLRDFIKHVYVDRKFTGERSMGRFAMAKAEDYSDRCSIERLSPGGRIDARSSRYYIDERSPRYKPDTVRPTGQRNRPVHFEIVDDRVRDDRFGNGRPYEMRRSSNAESRAVSSSPVSRKSREKTSPPVVNPVSDILGENVPPLQVGQSPKANERRANESSADGQKIASSSDTGSVDGSSLEHKTVNSGSLIDFSSDHESPDPAAAAQTQQTTLSIDGGNGATVPSSKEAKSSGAPNVNSLQSIFFELSVPTAGPVDLVSEAPGNADAPSATSVALSNGVGANVTESTTNTPAVPSTGDAPAASPVGMVSMLPSSSGDSMVSVTDGPQLPITHQNQSYSSPSVDSSSTTQQTTPSFGALYDQSWASSSAPNTQVPLSASGQELSQPISKVAQDTTSGIGSQALPVEPKSRGRKELPADLFTLSYSSFSAPNPCWQIRPPHGMGFGTQYHHTAAPTAAFPIAERSRNPFDFNDDIPQAQAQPQAPMFPSMLPMQGALPNLSAPTDAHSSQLMLPQASHYSPLSPPQLASYGMSLSPGTFMGQQLPNDMPCSRPQINNTVNRVEDAFASLNPIQQPGSRYPAPTSPSSFPSAGGNPFG